MKHSRNRNERRAAPTEMYFSFKVNIEPFAVAKSLNFDIIIVIISVV